MQVVLLGAASRVAETATAWATSRANPTWLTMAPSHCAMLVALSVTAALRSRLVAACVSFSTVAMWRSVDDQLECFSVSRYVYSAANIYEHRVCVCVCVCVCFVFNL